MGIEEKLAGAKKTSWISEGLTDAEVKTIVELAKISARIERCRMEMGMTQLEFAKYMGVSQGMVSKWESREYNFTIRTLNEICQKLDLEFSVELEKTYTKTMIYFGKLKNNTNVYAKLTEYNFNVIVKS